MINKTCCFSGHRKLPQNKYNDIKMLLEQEIENLINQGVTDFISGGALGFDLLAAAVIYNFKQTGKPIRLIFALPCKNHDLYWPESDRNLFRALIGTADEKVYVSEEYDENCMKLRNLYMVNRSSHCICALSNKRSGTGQTVNFAMKKGLNIINIINIIK